MTTTDHTALSAAAATPLELLGGHAGWSVVDPATVLSRLWYFDGKFLRADGFRRDQDYVRNLVAVSNKAVGHGIVDGFTASKSTGDRIRVEAGLGLAPSGRPLLLTTDVDLPIAELIARSRGVSAGSAGAASGHGSDFTRCPPDKADDGPTVVGATPMWVLYAVAIEALCGEEERYGQLCEEACATETDRSVVIEGVCFFVEQLPLALPTATTVTFSSRHLRSRYASAYYAWERSQTASFISGGGLRSTIWCEGADGVSGDAVALAVFDRAGESTAFVDAWTARRELTTQSPQRYWDWRMSRRPHDVFLAQILQFQCQLAGLPSDPGADGGDDCADERDALTAANDLLAQLVEMRDPDKEIDGTGMIRGVGEEAITRITELRKRVSDVLAGRIVSTTGSLLIDRGFVQLPPCGYLPVDPQRSVTAQVRAFMGPGVDLRFCAVRPDFIGEAMDEAQHLERISLTQGIDDRGDLEEVDVLVPGGVVGSTTVEASEVFEGTFQFRPRVAVKDDGSTTTGSAFALTTVAREHAGASWSWAMAGFGSTPDDADLTRLFGATLADAGVDHDKLKVDLTEPVEVPFVPEEATRRKLGDAAFRQGMQREQYYATARRALIDSKTFEAGFVDEEVRHIADRKLRPGEDRPLAMWFDLDIARSPAEMRVGESSTAALRLVLYARAKELPVLADLRVSGSLTVSDVTSGPAGNFGGQTTTITTSLSGVTDQLLVVGSNTQDREPRAIAGVELVWQVGEGSLGQKLLLVSMRKGTPDRSRSTSIRATDVGDPRHVSARLAMTVNGLPTHTRDVVGGDTTAVELASLELDELAGGFDASPSAVGVAEAAIDIIGAELAFPQRDPSFATVARERLLRPDRVVGREAEVSGTADWVFFHRRRTKVCGAAEAPTRPRRTYQLLHAVVDDDKQLARFRALLGVRARTADELPGFEAEDVADEVRSTDDLEYIKAYQPVAHLGFEPVAELEFEAGETPLLSTTELRNAWRGADRGTQLLFGAVGDLGPGDGRGVAEGRLSSVRGALQDLIETQRMRTMYLDSIPPEFRAPGLDGVMLTVGFRKPEVVVVGCLRLVRLTRDALKIMAEVFPNGLGEHSIDELLETLEKHGVGFSTLPANFDGDDTPLDSGSITHWWGPIPPSLGVLLTRKDRQESGDSDTDEHRASVVADLLGLKERGDTNAIGDTGDCDAVFLLLEGFATGRDIFRPVG